MTVEHVSPVAAALADAVADFGRRAVIDPARVRGLLSDALGSEARMHRAEIDALVVAVEEGIPRDLVDRQRGTSSVDDVELLARLAERGFDTSVSTFAIGAWGASLGSSTSLPNPLATTELPGTHAADLALTQAPPSVVAGAIGVHNGITSLPPEHVTVDLSTVDLAVKANGSSDAPAVVVAAPDAPSDMVPWPAGPESTTPATTTAQPGRRRVFVAIAVAVVVLLAAGLTWAVARPDSTGKAATNPKASPSTNTDADANAAADATSTAAAADFAKQTTAQVAVAQRAAAAAKSATARARAAAVDAASAASAARRARGNHSPENARKANARAHAAAGRAAKSERDAMTAKMAADAAVTSAVGLDAKTTQAAGSVSAAQISVTASAASLAAVRTAATQANAYLAAATRYRKGAAASAAAAKKAMNATHGKRSNGSSYPTPQPTPRPDPTPRPTPTPDPTTSGPPPPDEP